MRDRDRLFKKKKSERDAKREWSSERKVETRNTERGRSCAPGIESQNVRPILMYLVFVDGHLSLFYLSFSLSLSHSTLESRPLFHTWQGVRARRSLLFVAFHSAPTFPSTSIPLAHSLPFISHYRRGLLQILCRKMESKKREISSSLSAMSLFMILFILPSRND